VRWFHFISIPRPAPKAARLHGTGTSCPFMRTRALTRSRSSAVAGAECRRQGHETASGGVADQSFNPHLIARMRITAYQKNVVMKYIDNLMAWGDQLFSRDTIESITRQHTSTYSRPTCSPTSGTDSCCRHGCSRRPMLPCRPKQLDAFSNALVEMETAFPFGEEFSDGTLGTHKP